MSPPGPIVGYEEANHDRGLPGPGALRGAPIGPLPRWAALAVEIPAFALAAVAAHAATRSTPVTAAEAARVAALVEWGRPGAPVTGGGWSARLLDGLLAGWLSSTGGLLRDLPAVLAVRQAVLLATLLALAAVWLLTRRLGLSVPARGAVLVTLALPGPAVLFAGTVTPGPLAAAFLLLGVLPLAAQRPGTWSGLFGLLGVAVGALLVPAALPGILAGLAVLLAEGDLSARLGARWRYAAAGLVGALAAAGLWAVAGSAPHPPPVAAWELALGAVAVALAGLGLTRRWSRAPAVAVLVLTATAFVAPAGLWAVAVPALVVVAASAAEQALPRRNPAWSVRVALVATAAVLLAGLCVTQLLAVPGTASPGPVRDAAAWVGAELPATERVAVEDGLRADLVRAGLPAGRIDPDSGWRLSRGGTAGVVATFGPVTVSRRDGGAAPTGEQRRTRARAGAALAGNPRLTLTPAAADLLRAGDVELRLVLLLGTVTGQHALKIQDFPGVPGERGTPARRVLVTAVDGRPATTAESTALLRAWLDLQRDPYRPQGTTTTAEGLLVRYALFPEES
ncbi:hypothetical protein AB0M43_10995 [Longispora sp. NPDC051575]|uniref:hypothetical protein n=1 Tax=Longispora sp. NPDC051575 TaxID=3154943 RepID=UPI00341DAABF